MKFYALLFWCLATLCTHAQVYDITSYGAVGNGTTLNTVAIQTAVDSAWANGGGIVEVPTGNFLTGTVYLKSNVTLHISKDGTVTGSNNVAHFPEIIPAIRSYTDNYPHRAVFYAEGQHNIAITGEGTFNGGGADLMWVINRDDRPYGFKFVSCSNIRYEGLKMRHSAFWMMHNFNIDTLVVKNLNIINQAYGNNDGVNIDGCRNVLVDSVYADCNDDPMVIKTTSLIGCENIEIKNCTVATYSRAIKIGTEINGPVKNVHIHDCKVVLSTNGPFQNAHASCGINLSAVDGGSLENIRLENIDMVAVKTPITIRLGNRGRKYTDTAAVQGPGYARNIELRNITAICSSDTTSSISGIPGYAVKNVYLHDIDITFPGGWPALPANYPVPDNEGERPEADLFGDTLPAGGLYLRHVDSIRMQNVCFHTINPDGRPEIYADYVTNMDTSAICGRLMVDIGDETGRETIQVYPNPVNDNLIVSGLSLNGASVSISDVCGRTIKVAETDNPQVNINTTELARGTYVLSVVQGTSRFSRLLIKQ